MRHEGLSGDVHLVGGQRTVWAFLRISAIDSLGLVVLPTLLGDGARLMPPSTPSADLLRPPDGG